MASPMPSPYPPSPPAEAASLCQSLGLRQWPVPAPAQLSPILPEVWVGLCRHLAAQIEQRPHLMRLIAPQGMGKSTFLGILARTQANKVTCVAHPTALLPSAADSPSVRRASLALSRLLEEDEQTSPQDLTRALEVLVARRRPVLVIVDANSPLAPRLMVRLRDSMAMPGPDRAPVSLLVTEQGTPEARPLAPGPGAPDPLFAQQLEVEVPLTLPPLSQADAARLLVLWLTRVAEDPSTVAQRLPASAVIALADAADGNPLWLQHHLSQALVAAATQGETRLQPRHVSMATASSGRSPPRSDRQRGRHRGRHEGSRGDLHGASPAWLPLGVGGLVLVLCLLLWAHSSP